MPLGRILEPRVDAAYTLLRIVAGLLFAFHGAQKIFGVFSTHPSPAFGTQMWFGGMIELIAGVAIAAGLLTTWAAFLSSGTMAVAYVQFHWKFAMGEQLLPGVNKGELALLYAVLFLYIACRGPGPWSLDRKLFAARRR